MNLRNKGKSLLCLSLIGVLLTGCGANKTEEAAPQVVDAVNISIPYAETFDSPENVAIQYSNYIREGYWDYAFDLMSVPAGVLFNRQDLEAVECDITSVPYDYILIGAEQTSGGVRLTYGNKIGEAFSPAGKDTVSEYMGEVVTDTVSVIVPIVNDGVYPNMIGVQDIYLTDSVIAFRAPDAVEVWVGGKLLDEKSRDDEGYYLITDFVGTDMLNVKLVSDVEEKEIALNLTTDVPLDEETMDTTDVTTYTTEFPVGTHLGYPAYDYIWDTSRITNNEALAWVTEGVQAVFTSMCEQEDFYTGSFNSIMSEDANLEALKPMYTRVSSNFKDNKSRNYSDITVISVEPWTEDYMRRKNVGFRITDKHTMQMWVTLTYSYVVETIADGTEQVKTNTVEGYIEVSKDNGEWRLVGISDKILKGM